MSAPHATNGVWRKRVATSPRAGYLALVEFLPEELNRERVAPAFAEHRQAIQELISYAEVEHVGATSVPGALTKGDLDLLVSVPDEQFKRAATALQERYSIHQPENWTATFASFKEVPEGEIPVGVQLVVRGSHDEYLFIKWRKRLTAEPELLAEYNALKRDLSGADPDTYVTAKAQFIEAHMGSPSKGDPAPQIGPERSRGGNRTRID